jgi:hypothetical protein
LKGFIHKEKDAVTFYQSFGKGLCTECHVRSTDILYCQQCPDAGRIRPPLTQHQDTEDRLPIPTGPVTPNSRLYFILGIIGLILVAICIHIVWLAPITSALLHYLHHPFNPPSAILFLPRTIGFILVAIGFSLAGPAIVQFRNYFNFGPSRIIGIYAIISPWILVIGDLLIYTGLVYLPSLHYWTWDHGPLAPLSISLYILGHTLYGVLFVLISYVLSSVKKESGSESATKWARILFLVVACMLFIMVPSLVYDYFRDRFYYYSFNCIYFYNFIYPAMGAFRSWHAILLVPAVILTANSFYCLQKSLETFSFPKKSDDK